MKDFTADYIRTLQGNKSRYFEVVARPFIEKLEYDIERSACAGGSSIEYEINNYGDFFICFDFIKKYFKDRGFKVHIEYGNLVDGVDVLVIEW